MTQAVAFLLVPARCRQDFASQVCRLVPSAACLNGEHMKVTAGRHVSLISAEDFAMRLGRYGFTECADLRRFLLLVCDEHPGACETLYIWARLCECLEHHDNGSAWFADLRVMKLTARSALEHWQVKLSTEMGVYRALFTFG
jgi:hypothetical protein